MLRRVNLFFVGTACVLFFPSQQETLYDYYYCYVFRLKTPIVVENDTEMDPVRSTAGG